MQLGVPLPKTPSGRVYRYSPNPEAHPRHFVLGNATLNFVIREDAKQRMKIEPRSKQTVCPYSGIVAEDSAFTHPDDLKAALKLVEHAAIADVQEELTRAFAGFNQSQSRNSLIRIEAKVNQGFRPTPRFLRSDLLRDLVCDHCGRDYGVYAIGLFCPDCGAPNLRLHFAREVELVRKQVAMAKTQSEESQELAYRLLGNAHEDVLTAFEATLKAVYLHGVAPQKSNDQSIKSVKNDFQNVEVAQKRFAEIGVDPFECLAPEELVTLKLNIQKRHIIGHNLGVMDAKFAEHAEDARLGETVHLVGEDVCVFADLSQRVIDGLDTWLAGAPSPMPIAASAAGNGGSLGGASRDGEVGLKRGKTMELDLSPLAQRLGQWIAKSSEEGLDNDFISETALLADFSETSLPVMQEAVAELEMDRFISTVISGSQLPHIRPTLDLFTTFDPIAVGSDPTADAVELATIVIAGAEDVDVAALHEKSGWSKRRFNPALALVTKQIDDGHVSKTLDGNYPTRWFHVSAADRVALKRFISRTIGT